MGEYVGRILEAEAPPEGDWWRVVLDTGDVIYMQRQSLVGLVEQFGEVLAQTMFRFETDGATRKVDRVELRRDQPEGWSLPLPFHPDPMRTMDPPKDHEREMLAGILARIPERPVRSGMDQRMQRVRRQALGMMNSTTEAPYHPDPIDAEESSASWRPRRLVMGRSPTPSARPNRLHRVRAGPGRGRSAAEVIRQIRLRAAPS